MAMTDYFKKDACDKITQTDSANVHGNMTVVDSIASGSSFDGLLVKRALSSGTVGADRTSPSNTYNLFVYASEALSKDDKVRYTYANGEKVFIRLTSSAILNDEASGQTDWKTYEAETYEPTGGLS